MSQNDFPITDNDEGRRVDRIVRKMFPSFPLSMIYRLIRKGSITLNHHKTKPGKIAAKGDILTLDQSLADKYRDEKPRKCISENTGERLKEELRPLILFEDNHILVINKPPGLLVHGPDSLEQRVSAYFASETDTSLSFTPGPAHRLDRNTSGVILFSKSIRGARSLSEAFHNGRIIKVYIGCFEGIIENEIYWEDILARDSRNMTTKAGIHDRGKKAVTRIIPVKAAGEKTLAVCVLLTGVTHQIRSQAAIHGHPLFCDRKYGSRERTGRYILHAAGLSFFPEHPLFGGRLFTASLPGQTAARLTLIFGTSPLASAAGLVGTICQNCMKKGSCQ
ncbi:MAG: RluA family pseudouridine synthase [Spirochaetales bacterium]|nr:RluA family pseudouridine synthase [Spirochaetales bacterium]